MPPFTLVGHSSPLSDDECGVPPAQAHGDGGVPSEPEAEPPQHKYRKVSLPAPRMMTWQGRQAVCRWVATSTGEVQPVHVVVTGVRRTKQGSLKTWMQFQDEFGKMRWLDAWVDATNEGGEFHEPELAQLQHITQLPPVNSEQGVPDKLAALKRDICSKYTRNYAEHCKGLIDVTLILPKAAANALFELRLAARDHITIGPYGGVVMVKATTWGQEKLEVAYHFAWINELQCTTEVIGLQKKDIYLTFHV